jgi:1-aminocyclopropane-1-carboxylate deaminase/D-cysteine desulfhydrase-like pyridoxal-dependent ACC family enzyme
MQVLDMKSILDIPNRGTIPLFDNHPKLQNDIPWVKLGNWPTPVHKLENLGRKVGYDNLWIKRDDKTSDNYGGNKVRKLEFVLADAMKKRRQTIVTYGGLGTNHGLATTIFSKQVGLDTILVLQDQPLTDHVQENLLLHHYYNAKLIHVANKYDSLLKTMRFRIFNRGYYFLPPGGSSPLGCLGFVNAALELKEQIDSGQVPEPGYIFCPLGTAGTLTGLTIGCKLAGMRTKVIGIRVTDLSMSNSIAITRLANKTSTYLSYCDNSIPQLKFTIDDFSINHKFIGPGYGCPTTEGKEALDMMWETEKIMLEVTYTAKTLAAVLDFAARQPVGTPPILYWHTYNGVDFTKVIMRNHDYTNLPGCFHRFFKQNLISYIDR